MTSRVLVTRAPAKVNLTLHVLGRRADGFHELESLVVFAGVADRLALTPGPELALSVDGPTAGASGPAGENLVLHAARALADAVPGLRAGAFRLTKNLPAAAGIGGGSSDAAGALRLLAELNGLPVHDGRVVAAARRTGADVPVCLDPRARMMRGVGERVGPPLRLPPVFGLLVNPRVAVPTPEVFRRLGRVAGEVGPSDHPEIEDGLSAAALLALLARGRNDLEPPAVAAEPLIRTALDRLASLEGCRLARMSGSGATAFGLFDDCRSAARAARALGAAQPGWWVKPTVLR